MSGGHTSLRATLAHAFAVKDTRPWAPEDLALLDRLADAVAVRRMQAPAVLFLESVRPLNFLGSQAMTFFKPVAEVVFSAADWDRVAGMLERREAIELLLGKIEARRG